jgi:biotin carboxylase
MTARDPLLVLGAGEDQLPIYREARRRGLPTIAVDARRDRPALALADAFLQVSTRDHEAIAAAVGPARLSGVVSTASDACLLSVHELARRYEAPFVPSRSAALASMDKAHFHEVVAAAGVARYRWAAADDRRALSRLTGPVVVKPVDASGSRGVSLVPDPRDVPAAVAVARAASFSGQVVVEEFLEGRNITVELFLRGGAPHFAAVSEKRLAPGGGFVIHGHTCPAPLTGRASRAVVEAATRVALAMGLADGPINVDVILAPDGTPYVLEAGARLCGNAFPLLLRAIRGVDTIEALVDLALGRPFDLTPTRARHALLHVLASPLGADGVLEAVEHVDEVRALDGVECLEVYADPGDLALPFTQSANKLGYLVVVGDTPEQAAAALRRALRLLRVVVTIKEDPYVPA